MPDLFSAPFPSSAPSLSVSELNRRARQVLESGIPLLWVTGEISNLVRAASGHLYFTLKDESAQVRCVMFRSRANLVPWQIANGQQVEVQALVSIYEARGDFQLNIEGMRRGGLGRLYEAFARLREQLEGEGLFAPERKRTLPAFPHTIGIVTSLQAAALRDVVAAIRRRAPHVKLVVFPTPVQGDGAGEKIAQAISCANESATCDLLIVARGGGSIEDLWAFNEEIVARAIVASSIPVISGVGHETDVTIADFVADLRAATPTAAAELATAGWHATIAEIDQVQRVLRRLVQRQIEARMQRIDLLSRRLLHPRQRLERIGLSTEHLHMRLTNALRHTINRQATRVSALQLSLQRQQPVVALHRADLNAVSRRLTLAAQASLLRHQRRVDAAAEALKLLDPTATLSRGYCIVRNQQNRTISDSAELDKGDFIAVQFASGSARALVTQTD